MTVPTLAAALRLARTAMDRLEARLLVEKVCACRHADLIARPETAVSAEQWACLEALVARRAAGEPLAYLTGEAEFRGRLFQVSPAVLIPRPETEHLVELAREKVAALPAPRILDLGTGSGIVAASLALEIPAARVMAVDISTEALAVAQANARRLGADVEFCQGNWFAPVGARVFDLVVSNPPYVAEDDPHLLGDGLPFEPRGALTDGERGGDGLACIRTIVGQAAGHLVPGGWLLFEHGYDQGAASRNLLTAAGFLDVFTQPDLAGTDRISGGRL